MERIRAAAADAFAPNTHRAYRTAWAAFAPVGRWRRVPGPPRRARRRRRLPHGPIRSGALPLLAPSGPPGDPRRPPRGGRRGPVRLRRRPARLRGLSRQRAGQGGRRQAAALTAEALAAIRATAAAPRTGPTGRTESHRAARIRGAVDVALASVMRDAMLRRSEAAALEWADVELRPDGSGRLRVRRSKTDQEGEGAVQYLGKGTAAAVREIRPGNPDPDARVFGLRSGRSVARRLAAMARAAGLEGAFSGHSPRIGMAQDLVASGASVAAVQVAGRWKSPRMPAHYARGELAARGAVARFYGE